MRQNTMDTGLSLSELEQLVEEQQSTKKVSK
jgi:hypothetical protein